jgi:hypothetical protein
MGGAAGAECRRAALLSVVLTVPVGTAIAGVEQNVEDRFDEARAKPATVAQQGNWVFVPIPVANPTVGNGLQVAAMYLHPKAPGPQGGPSTTSGAIAMATDSGSRLLGAFHDGSYADDRYRLSAFAGRGKFQLKFYGIGDGAVAGSQAVAYEMSGTLAQVRGEVRLPGTDHWFTGLTYQFLDTTLTVQSSQLVPGLPDVPIKFRNAGLGPHITYDSRDSNYFPLQGQYFRAGWLNYSPNWGGDFAFDKGDVFYNLYLPLAKATVLALRTRLQSASNDTPFYELPTLDMRGFSRDRYRDNATMSLTAEWRHKFSQRWGMIAFAETGRVAPSLGKLSEGRAINSAGGGVRWQVTADREMNVGLDFAVSTDDRAVFIQIGEKF